jgi:type VI protein secretion system component VasK
MVTQTQTTERPNWLLIFAAIIAVLLIFGYLVSLYILREQVGVEDPSWSRLVFLLVGLEALVFSSAGFLFGHLPARAAIDAANAASQASQNAAKEAQATADDAQAEAIRLKARIIGLPLNGVGGPVGFTNNPVAGQILASEVQNLKDEITRTNP